MGSDGGAGLGESDSNGRAHSSGGASDERNFIVETEGFEDVGHDEDNFTLALARRANPRSGGSKKSPVLGGDLPR